MLSEERAHVRIALMFIKTLVHVALGADAGAASAIIHQIGPLATRYFLYRLQGRQPEHEKVRELVIQPELRRRRALCHKVGIPHTCQHAHVDSSPPKRIVIGRRPNPTIIILLAVPKCSIVKSRTQEYERI
jgi:hypothetical protein